MITNAIIHDGIHTSFDIIGIQFYENIVQEQNSEEQNCDEQEVIPSDMLAVSYNNEWSSKVEKVPSYHTALDLLIWTLPSFIGNK